MTRKIGAADDFGRLVGSSFIDLDVEHLPDCIGTRIAAVPDVAFDVINGRDRDLHIGTR
jgi:hypothetical protein